MQNTDMWELFDNLKTVKYIPVEQTDSPQDRSQIELAQQSQAEKVWDALFGNNLSSFSEP